jgi:hypothetical protein
MPGIHTACHTPKRVTATRAQQRHDSQTQRMCGWEGVRVRLMPANTLPMLQSVA